MRFKGKNIVKASVESKSSLPYRERETDRHIDRQTDIHTDRDRE